MKSWWGWNSMMAYLGSFHSKGMPGYIIANPQLRLPGISDQETIKAGSNSYSVFKHILC
jgi:hypothetical protein